MNVNNYKIKPYADLSRADLHAADLHAANLQRSNLFRANLSAANLSAANLSEANLYGANLHATDLHAADLSGADLHAADLYAADLSGADLSGANLYDTKNIVTIGPIGSRRDLLYAVKHDRKIMFKTGCFWGTGPELLKATNKTHGVGTPYTIQYRQAIQMARIIFEQYEEVDR